MEEIQAQLISAAITIIVTCIGIVSGYAGKFLRERFSVERLDRSKKYAEIAVQFVEQIGQDLNSKQKFEIAKKRLVLMLNHNNIKISNDEMDALIEAMVAEMNRSFKEELNGGRITTGTLNAANVEWRGVSKYQPVKASTYYTDFGLSTSQSTCVENDEMICTEVSDGEHCSSCTVTSDEIHIKANKINIDQ
ncbi:phage holin, LLH family [Siminovitchia fordii]|uniref:Uncharacterized protein n=1 Tax=Siminovitchia fordii TaxID=254759 RepID=A0ABQ4KDJ3_9BACI|nr:phage holin, LLH family [Siminovitchia fordii]GIN23136.1 hypothetical protein J1TS3_42700 [Siminovitchia fordii]